MEKVNKKSLAQNDEKKTDVKATKEIKKEVTTPKK